MPNQLQTMQTLAAIPDDMQNERINILMTTSDDREDSRNGLMAMGHRILREYPDDFRARDHAEKYAEVIKHLQKQRYVAYWMSRNRTCWAWMEPEASQAMQSRSDHSGRRGGGHQNMHAHHQNHDPNAVDDDSEFDDDSRSYDEEPILNYVDVDGCGVYEINGTYKRSGTYDGVAKYSRTARYRGKEEEFSLFRCKLTDNTR